MRDVWHLSNHLALCTLLTHGVAILPNADRGNLLLYLAQLFA